MVSQELVADVERLLEEAESLADPVARQTTTGVVQALLELYGAGLERIVELVVESEAGEALASAFSEDELVSHLLLLHGLHPVPVEERVLGALETVRPYLESHGGNVSVLGIEGSTVRLRLQGSCSGCPSSAMTLKLAIEDAIRKAAPEIDQVVADEAPATPLLHIGLAPGLVPAAPASSAPGEAGVMTVGAVPGNGPTTREVAGASLVFLRVAGRLLAYRARCPACEQSLEGATVDRTELVCGGCGNRFDALRAGRGLDLPELHLEPVPLLEGDDGLVRIVVPVAV
jgi:Fe-S cluster biogenesis protein NfuA/nitrite reductase/ring-hydroxylating ferredoxin subunit